MAVASSAPVPLTKAGKPRKQRTDFSRYKGRLHVSKLKLLANQREGQILFERMRVSQKLKNDVKGLLIKRVNGMRNDPRFLTASKMSQKTEAELALRQCAFKVLRTNYQLELKDVSRLGEEVLKRKEWMRDILTVQLANKAGLEVWEEVEAWMYGKKGKPHFRESDEPSAVWGNQIHSGLIVRDGQLIWPSLASSQRKDLSIPIDYSSLSGPRRARFESLEPPRYGISREKIRGEWVYLLLVCLKGEAYRNQDYLDSIPVDDLSAYDPGISYMAVATPREAHVVKLITEVEIEKSKERVRYERRMKRKIGRSRKAMNPEAFDKQRRSIKGVKQPDLGRDARRLEEKLAEAQRRGAIERKQRAHKTIHELVKSGARVVIEKNSFKAFQRIWGKRMGLTAPGQFIALLIAEALRVGGVAIILPATDHALSQYCLCGSKVKKDISETIHHCHDCGLGPLDRNLFSAFLALSLVESNLHEQPKVLREAPFGAAGYRREAVRLCGLPRPRSAASCERQAPHGGAHRGSKTGVLAGDQDVQTPGEYRAVKEASDSLSLPDTSWGPAGTYSVSCPSGVTLRGS